MRQEIITALEQASIQHADDGLSGKPSVPENHSLNPMIVNLTQNQKMNLDYVDHNQRMLHSCVEHMGGIKSVEIGTTSSIEVYWNDTTSNIVIELSLYGPIAAVFEYGDAPNEVRQHIDDCLNTLGLLRLSAEEIKDLEKLGVYHQLF